MMTKEEIFDFERNEYGKIDFDFYFSVTGLAHGHIYGMCNGLLAAGAKLAGVYDEDANALSAFLKAYPDTPVYESLDELLADSKVGLVATAAIPSLRADITVKTMLAGKDAFVDKAPLISHKQLELVKRTSEQTGRKLFIFYSEFCISESAIYAKHLIERGVIGKVCHVNILSPHLLNAPTRPKWFFERDKTGGILIDIGSHQFYQFLEFSGAKCATVDSARVANYTQGSPAEFDDFGDATLTADNGVTGYLRIDWLSPKGHGTWGDSKVIIEGTDGYIELRKNCNIGYEFTTENVFVVTNDGTYNDTVRGKVNPPYFSSVILDSIHRTDTSMPPELAYEAIDLAIRAQNMALGLPEYN